MSKLNKRTALLDKPDVQRREMANDNKSKHHNANADIFDEWFHYQTHKQAIYTSKLLDFQNLSEPVNAASESRIIIANTTTLEDF